MARKNNNKKIPFFVKLEIFVLIYISIIFEIPKTYILGITSSRFEEINKVNNLGRDLEEVNEYDSYIVLYFNQDCNYLLGFQNDYRNDVSFIINEENNDKLTCEDELIIHKGIEIEIHFNKSVESLESFFDIYYDENVQFLVSIDFTNFDSSLVTTFYRLFNGCSSLKSIDFTNFNTSLVNNICCMFEGCISLQSINLSNFNTSLVTCIGSMFYECRSLRTINLSNFNTSKVTYMSDMFRECNSLQSINLSNFNTSLVTDMSYMFFSCNSLKEINLSNFNTSLVDDMSYMFHLCNSSQSIDISNFDTSSVTRMNGMFYGCSSL